MCLIQLSIEVFPSVLFITILASQILTRWTTNINNACVLWRLNKKYDNIKKRDKAPDFSGLDQDGNAHKLADYKGKKLVVFFIQKQVPHCTAEAVILEIILSALKRITMNY
jgi:hypothetical protein